MKYYTATRGTLTSPVYKYFSSIDELNAYYNIESKEEDYGCGYCFEFENNHFLLGKSKVNIPILNIYMNIYYENIERKK